MRITKEQLKEIISEELNEMDIPELIPQQVGEALSPAIAAAMKAKGMSTDGANLKPAHAGASAQHRGQTVYAKGGGKPEKHFDDQTGAPLTAKGKELCAKNPQCKKKHLSGGGGGQGPDRTQMSQILGKNYLNMKRSLENIDKNAMMADEVLEAFKNFENLFLTFNKQYRSGR